MKLKGKVAIVTGGARGIGGAIVSACAREGASIVIPDIDFKEARTKAEEIESIGQRSIPVECNVLNPEQVERMVRTTVEYFGRIDILVNNAGLSHFSPFIDTTLENWKLIVDLNLTGYFLCAKAAAKEMVKAGKGKIIQITSVASLTALTRSSAYSAAKGGIAAATRVMAIELAPYHINVNAIAPGFIMTDLARKTLSNSDIKSRQERIPWGRYGKPEDVAGAAVFLASNESDYITGTTIVVDGGFTCAGIM